MRIVTGGGGKAEQEYMNEMQLQLNSLLHIATTTPTLHAALLMHYEDYGQLAEDGLKIVCVSVQRQ